MSLKTIAEVYRLGLIIGYFSKNEVIQWADNLIEQMENPSSELIDVSMTASGKSADVAHALNLIRGDYSEELAIKIVLGMLYRRLKEQSNQSDIVDVVDYLGRLTNAVSVDSMGEDVYWEIDSIGDAYYLVEQNIYGNLNEVQHRVEQLLQLYSKYALDFESK